MNANRKAFLDMIAVSEGTKGKGADGYNVIVGGKLFYSYATHPNKLVHINAHLESTAAGRYQLLYRFFVAYAKQLGLHDFSPASQDAIAIQQIKERNALEDIDHGRFEQAIGKIRNIWASLPGAGYGQHENTYSALRMAYIQFGGTLA